MHILVAASTFPASAADEAPGFVREQVVALKRHYPEVRFSVLAPHYRDRTPAHSSHPHYDEYRFSYFFPAKLQQLAGRGILPAIERNPALLALVPFLFFFELVALIRIIRRLRPDFVYAHWFTPQGFNAAIASKLTRTPFVLTSHANDVHIWNKVPVIGRVVVRRMLPLAHRITAVSSTTRDKMRAFFSAREWGALAPKVAIIPMGVDVAEFQETPGAGGSELKSRYGCEGRFVVLFLGRLASKKGVGYLLEAMARIEAPHAQLVIAGDGPLREPLEKQVHDLGLTRTVRFVGYVSGSVKGDYLRMADVVVVPSVETPSGDSEGFPVVIMEAMAAGAICIASNASGAENIILPGRNGFIVPQKHAAALAEQIEAVMRLEGAERQRIAAMARQAVESLDWSHIAPRHFEFLFADQLPSAAGGVGPRREAPSVHA